MQELAPDELWEAVRAAYPRREPLLDKFDHWIAQARTIPGFTLQTRLEGDGVGALSLFSIEGVDSRALERELRETHRVHVKHRRVRHLEDLRVSPHIYMETGELDRFVEVLARSVRRLRMH